MREYRLSGKYIELIKLLKLLNIAATGGHAKIIVDNGEVMRNGEVEFRKRAKIIRGDTLTIHEEVISIK